MERDDIIRMAREADGFEYYERESDDIPCSVEFSLTDLATFVALVAAHERAEELLKKPVAWRFRAGVSYPWSLTDDGYYASCMRNQSYLVEPLYAIRARGEK